MGHSILQGVDMEKLKKKTINPEARKYFLFQTRTVYGLHPSSNK
jgi:hypothetical protein